MIEFTHAIYDDEGNIIRKLRMSKTEYAWYRKEKPFLDIRKLDTKPKKNLQQELFNLVGECLL
jgi:hypothetical protein